MGVWNGDVRVSGVPMPTGPFHSRTIEAGMTMYLISLALAGLIGIAVWEALS
jgi:hypothetical protein